MITELHDGAILRRATPGDHAALYDICLRTGDSGGDATEFYDDPRLLGDFFAVPYQVLQPDFAFVLEVGGEVLGYVLGAPDTQAFTTRMEAEWLPRLRERVADPGPDRSAWGPSDWVKCLIHRPEPLHPALAPYPSHGHIDLLPRAQGRGYGARMMGLLMQSLAAAGSPGLHLGVSPANAAARAFYRKLGFLDLEAAGFDPHTTYMVRNL